MSSLMQSLESVKKPNVIAVENSVVDLQYLDEEGDDRLKNELFSHLKEYIERAGFEAGFEDNPRAGDMCLISAEAFDGGMIEFGLDHGLLSAEDQERLSPIRQAEKVRTHIFGRAEAIAGGSLANTFHSLLCAEVNGSPLITGKFVTATSNSKTGRIFEESLDKHIKNKRAGRQLVCHVFPTGGDRILIATPSTEDPSESHITADLLDGEITKDVDRVMIGGFLFFTGRFQEIVDKAVSEMQALAPADRPTLVMTAAAQAVAEQPLFREEVWKAARTTDLVIHANTGEYRRLLDIDTEWRKPFLKDFEGLKGQALEEAKKAHDPYQRAKQAANKAAIAKGQSIATRIYNETGNRLLFVVTNGSKQIYNIWGGHMERVSNGQSDSGLFEDAPLKIDGSKIVNTVGAGDNFAAGFQLGHLYSLPLHVCNRMGSEMAGNVIQVSSARLDDNKERLARVGKLKYRLKGSAAYLSDTSLGLTNTLTKGRTPTPPKP